MENDKKAMIQTVIISLLICLTRLLVIPSEINFIFQNMFRDKEKAYIFLIWIPIQALYYFVVMRERKSDKFYDSNKKRIKCSMLILFFGMLIYVSVVSVFTQLSSDVHPFIHYVPDPAVTNTFERLFIPGNFYKSSENYM